MSAPRPKLPLIPQRPKVWCRLLSSRSRERLLNSYIGLELLQNSPVNGLAIGCAEALLMTAKRNTHEKLKRWENQPLVAGGLFLVGHLAQSVEQRTKCETQITTIFQAPLVIGVMRAISGHALF